MVGSFYILAMLAVFRVWVQVDWIDKFSWLEQVIPYLNWAVIGMAVIFVLFTIVTLFNKLFRRK